MARHRPEAKPRLNAWSPKSIDLFTKYEEKPDNMLVIRGQCGENPHHRMSQEPIKRPKDSFWALQANWAGLPSTILTM